MNGFDLLVQIKIALVFLHLAFDTATDALVDIQDVHFTFELGIEVFQALFDLRQIEHCLLVLKLQGQVCRDGVSQATRIVNAGNRGENFRGDFFIQFDVLVKLLHDRTAQSLDLGVLVPHLGGLHWRQGTNKVRSAIFNVVDHGALLAFDQHLDGAIGQFEHLQNGGYTSHLEHIGDQRLVFGGGFLSNQHDATVCRHGGFQRLDALGSAHKQRDNHVRKHHHIAQRQQGQIDSNGGQRGLS